MMKGAVLILGLAAAAQAMFFDNFQDDRFGSRSGSNIGESFLKKEALSDASKHQFDFFNDFFTGQGLKAASRDDHAAQTDYETAHEDFEVTNLSHDKNQQLKIVDQSSLDFQHKNGNRDLVDFSDKKAASKDSALDYQDVVKDKTALSKKEASDYNTAYANENKFFDKEFYELFGN